MMAALGGRNTGEECRDMSWGHYIYKRIPRVVCTAISPCIDEADFQEGIEKYEKHSTYLLLLLLLLVVVVVLGYPNHEQGNSCVSS